MRFLIAALASLSMVAAQQYGTRTFTMINHCSFPVWPAIAGGGGSAKNGGQCNTDGDCWGGQQCVQTGAIRQCFWKSPAPNNGNWEVAPGAQTTFSFPIMNINLQTHAIEQGVIWSGIIGGRTGCTNGKCQTANCGADDGSWPCKPGAGLMQPAAQAEFTLGANNQDYYDITIINGWNIPMEMRAVQQPNTSPGNAYWCGNPGGITPRAPGQAAATWKFNPPTPDYIWVTAGGKGCNTQSDCGGQTCGLAWNVGQATAFSRVCGTQLGYWSADEICGISNQFTGSGMACNDNYMVELYGCTNGIMSGYNGAAQNGANTCGCANWWQVGVPSVPSSTQKCVGSNPTWVNNVQPKLLWMKQGCPSCYTFPFDDMSSTFVCNNPDGNHINIVDYEIHYCPVSGGGGGGGGGGGSTTTAPSAQSGYTLNANTDYSGNDLTSTAVSKTADCASLCNSNANCKGFVVNGAGNYCWQKSAMVGASSNSDREGYTKTGGNNNNNAPTSADKITAVSVPTNVAAKAAKFNVNVNYVANGNRVLVADVLLPSANYAKFGTGSTAVGIGSGVATITVTLSNNPAAGSAYYLNLWEVDAGTFQNGNNANAWQSASSTTPYSNFVLTNANPAAPSSTSIGCFQDNAASGAPRTLPTALGSSNSMTPAMCIQLGVKAGITFVGTEYGTECWGGNNRPSTASSNCGSPCAGDASQKCGGGWALTVYNAGVAGLAFDVDTSAVAADMAASGSDGADASPSSGLNIIYIIIPVVAVAVIVAVVVGIIVYKKKNSADTNSMKMVNLTV